MRLAALVATTLLVGCNLGNGDDGGGIDSGGGSGALTGHILADTTWSGTVTINSITINAGVRVDVMPGTIIEVSPTGVIAIAGTLAVAGTSAAKVTIRPATGTYFGGVQVLMGGQLTMHYGVQTGGGIETRGGGATIVDTAMSSVNTDFLVMNGGTLDMSYSSIGKPLGMTDTIHCDMHFAGLGNVIKVTHSSISTSTYGLMFYSGNAADLTANNWFSNTYDLDTQIAYPVSGDFSGGYFQKGPPTGASGTQITANSLASAPLVDVGPRP
jgi:hypothetical protein